MAEATQIFHFIEVKEITRLFANPSKSLRDYFDIGRCMASLVERQGENAKKGLRSKVAKAAGVSPESLNKCCQFVEKYSEAQLAEVESLGIGWGLLAASFCIEPTAKRHKLLKEAKAGEWTSRELLTNIRGDTHTSRGGGRPQRKLKSFGLAQDLREVGKQCEKFSKWIRMICAEKQGHEKRLRRLKDEEKLALARITSSVVIALKSNEKECKELLLFLRELEGVLNDK